MVFILPARKDNRFNDEFYLKCGYNQTLLMTVQHSLKSKFSTYI